LKQIILGTAGHIDHGKTSLVKATSGYDTDRLKEEKLRGITIELGFAALDLPSGIHIGIVDVPGHEKFVKHMVAGASGIDIVAMIIAADEGVMPQTREHFEICTLLGIQHGIIVLTKIDLVDEEWRELVIEDIRAFVKGTFLENAPIMPVSAVSGEGISEFINTLDRLCAELPEKKSTGLFRLPVDRVFTMKGFGTVITGTLLSGRVSVGETIMIYPSGITSKIRGLQVHDQPVSEAGAHMRTAINFQGIEKAAVNRGDVLALPGTLETSYMLDVELHLLGSIPRPLKNRERIRFHTGTAELPCNVILLNREDLEPGDTALAQLRLDSPVACIRDDRFVVRSYSPVRTLGGGRILDPVPQKHKRLKAKTNQHLQILLNPNPETIIMEHAANAGYEGVTLGGLAIRTRLYGGELDAVLDALIARKMLIQADAELRQYIHQETFEGFKQKLAEALKRYHRLHPLKTGMSRAEMKAKFPAVLGEKLFKQMLTMAVKDGVIVQSENDTRLPEHRVTLGSDGSQIKQKIEDAYFKSGLQPPYFKELAADLTLEPAASKNVLMLLVDEGVIVRVKEDLFFHAEVINELKKRLVTFLRSNPEITTPQFKEMTQASRKYTIPLLEYFDAINFTIRVGDARKLRKPA